MRYLHGSRVWTAWLERGSFEGGRMSHSRRQTGDLLVDDFRSTRLQSLLGTSWRGVSDRVMGGISQESLTHQVIDGRPCLHLTGEVSLENNGGFIQAALDLAEDQRTLDASDLAGVRIVVSGNSETYSVHLRTPDNVRSWQSYRAQFVAKDCWCEVRLPFRTFQPHRLELPLDTGHLRRIGLVAIGRAFQADLAVAELGFYCSSEAGEAGDGSQERP